MRAEPSRYLVETRPTLAATLELMGREPSVWRPLAGGTDVMVAFESGRLAHERWLSIWHLNELRGISIDERFVTLGALTTYSELAGHAVIQSDLPLLVAAARATGAIAIQNRGTLGGNIANASPAADTPPVLLAYGAEIELASTRGARWLAYDGFHTGYKTTQAASDELITRIRIERPRGEVRAAFRKVGARRAQAISKVCVAACVSREDGVVREARIGLGSVAATPVRARHAEAVLVGRALSPALAVQARDAVLEDISPIDDIRSTAEYRRRVVQNLVEQFVRDFAKP